MDITIKHKSGKSNVSLSCRCTAEESQISMVEEMPDLKEVSKSQMEDSDLSAMITHLQYDTSPKYQNNASCLKLCMVCSITRI